MLLTLLTYPLRFEVQNYNVLTLPTATSINERLDINIYKSDLQGLSNIVSSLLAKGFSIELEQINDDCIDYLFYNGDVYYRVIYYLNTRMLYGFCSNYKQSYEIFNFIDFP